MGSAGRVAIIALGRGVPGEQRRIESWAAIFQAAGATVEVVDLMHEHRASPRSIVAQAPGVIRGAVPETLAWSSASLTRRLRALKPDVIVAVTTRAFTPGLVAAAPRVVLDYVDALSVSYRDRSRLAPTRLARLRYRLLAPGQRRAERRRDERVTRTAAGFADAEALGAEWVPNVVDLQPAPMSVAPAHDVLFLGSLYYEPNVDALEQLAAAWPEVLRARPGTRALIAGRRPTERVREMAHAHGWTVLPDFEQLAAVGADTRIAVAPLTRASGIQNKVIEAAALGIPQVVTPAAIAGLRPGFPAVVVPVPTTPPALAASLVALLDDAPRQVALRVDALAEVERFYRPGAWASFATRLVGR